MSVTFKAKRPQYKCRHHCQSHMVLYNFLKYSKTVLIFPELLEESQSQMEKKDKIEVTNKQKQKPLKPNIFLARKALQK